MSGRAYRVPSMDPASQIQLLLIGLAIIAALIGLVLPK
jgi:hypothetical protein